MMEIIIERLVGIEHARRACELTMHGQGSKISITSLAKCEHSPLRMINYWVELRGIPTFVSVHLVRHHMGITGPFVQSMRDDLYIDETVKVDRDTPVNHGMMINAQGLINIARKRLCYKAHRKVVAVMRKLLKEVAKLEPELAPFLVPECVYRNGLCPELRECRPGLNKILSAYGRPDLIKTTTT